MPEGPAESSANADPVERILWDGEPLAYVIRGTVGPEKTTFLTPPELQLQVGFVVYPKEGEIPRHLHLSHERNLVGSSEVLIVRRGNCLVDLYNKQGALVTTRESSRTEVVSFFSIASFRGS